MERTRISLVLASLLGVVCTVPPARAQSDSLLPALRAVEPTHFDTTCAPCRDFFGYVNGGWSKRTEIPARYTLAGVDRDVQDRTEALLRRILDQAGSAAATSRDRTTRLVGLFYKTCMDSARAEREGYAPIAPQLVRIGNIRSLAALAGTLGSLRRAGVDAGVPHFADPDFKNSDIQFLHLSQGGTGLPDRDLYLLPDSSHVAIRAKYRAHLIRMLALIGEPNPQASATRVIAIEKVLARGALRAEDARDVSKLDHRMSVVQLRQLAPAFDWNRYFASLGTPALTSLNVGVPSEVSAFGRLVRTEPLADWRAYLRWRLASAAAPYLSTRFQQEALELRKIIGGQTELKPRWQRCLDATDQKIGEALGQAYVRLAFTPAAKARMGEMIENIREATRARIHALEWMSDSTKSSALAKLDALTAKIGYPDRWRDYSALRISEGPFIVNVLTANEFETARRMAQIYKPVDRTEWGMTPPTFNAYNNTSLNEIVLPAGILQPPLFDPKADDAVNYGAAGGVIGHELTHAFDDQGRKFDAKGNLKNWWTSRDSAQFEARSKVIVDQYTRYIAIDTFHVNGKLTLGENIADIGGLMIAYDAWQRSLAGKPEPPAVDGFTPDQRFFIAYAESWRQKVRPETELTQVIANPHTSVRWRVNGVVGHLPAFAHAFGCSADDPLVLTPEKRMQIW